ncbi:MAG: hypothetical protein HY720_08335 [Planctomycetes bacterium]|nr:hypothetical protein [Planctomycetota bacterium]
MKHVRTTRHGAGLTEYAIVVVLVAMALVLAVMFFSTEVIHGYGGVAVPEIEQLDANPSNP